MKKLFGLLVIGAVGMFIACSSDDSDSPSNPGNYALTPADCQSRGMAFNVDPTTGVAFCETLAPVAASSSDAAGVPNSADNAASSAGGFTPTPVAASSSSLNAVPVASSSSVAAVVPVASSSSVAAPASSASDPVTPKSSAVVEDADDGTFKLGLWDGTAGAGQVPTGNKKGGYWYSYDDAANGGESSITWCSEAGSTYSDKDLAPVIKENKGLCGTVELLVGTNEWKPYVAVAFSYGDKASLTADATAAKGVCISYESDIPMKLSLGVAKSLNGEEPYVDLKAGTKTVEFAWAEFAPPSWSESEIDGPVAAKTLSNITIKFEGDTDGEDGEGGSFLIKKVGAIGDCN